MNLCGIKQLALALVFSLVFTLPQLATAQEERTVAQPHDAAQGIIDLFDDYQLVGLCEDHRVAQHHEFYIDLITNPTFAESVDDIIVEFGNALYQDIMDRYIDGEEVPIKELSKAWRNTTQFVVWNSSVYANFLKTVREVNQALPDEKRLRVLLADPPIDWSKVTSIEDYDVFAGRDDHWFKVIENEVIEKGRRGLVIAGGVHFWRRSPQDNFVPQSIQEGMIGDILDQEYPGKTYMINYVQKNSSLMKEFRKWDVPSLVTLQGTELGAKSFGLLTTGSLAFRQEVDGEMVWVPLDADHWPPIEKMVDGLLYLGKKFTNVPAPPGTYQDAEYVSELKRRAKIMDAYYGFSPGYEQDLKELLKKRK